MKKRVTYLLILALVAIGVLVIWNISKPTFTVDFSTHIKPILNKNCISCHGGVSKNAGFSLLFEEEAFANTKSGKPAIIPGNAAGSELIKRIKMHDPELRMPYKKNKLADEDIEMLTKWINQGAKWGEHWAYSLPETVAVPKLADYAGLSANENSSFLINNIDRFILARLGDEDLTPNDLASPNVLSRRVALDLIGLPPSETMAENIVNGNLSYESLVDSLLASPSFGEKWASWWLDMARFADSKGYEKDDGRTMWAYRDWLIKAFNNDMPYDQFTIEQLAGDLLPEPSTDQLIATAFHRNTMINDEGGTSDEEFRVAAVIDRVNTTFEVWQSTTMGCVQCHSHPYDPIKHKEYYQLMDFFNNSMDEDTPGEEPALKFYTPDQQKEVDKVNAWVSQYGDKEIAKSYGDFLKFTEPVYHAHRCTNLSNAALDGYKWLALWDDGSAQLKNINTQGASWMYFLHRSGNNGTKVTVKRNNAEGEILAQFTINKTKGNIICKVPLKKMDGAINLYFEANNDNIASKANTSVIAWFAFLKDLPGQDQPGFAKIDQTFMNLINTSTPKLAIMGDNPDYMKRPTQLFERGNWLLKGDTVEAGTPQILNTWKDNWPKNRLGLSKWMVDKQNPLTARTLVNRVWHQLFGRGLVSTIEDIGSQSAAPSHPTLLDWLALRFMNEHHWSIKALIKEIVLSGTYRQSSIDSPDAYLEDPDNELYARGPRQRLSAEQIRDQALAVSGLLSSKMYGPSVMPPQPDGVWETVYSGQRWIESEGEDRYRKGVYTYIKRTSPYPSFLTFDAGSREVCTIRRTVTNTPLQALVTLNDPVYLEAAYHLAKKMQDAHKDIDKSIASGYKKATLSNINDTQLATLKALYETSFKAFEGNTKAIKNFLTYQEDPTAQLAALTVVANAIMNLDEFLTKA